MNAPRKLSAAVSGNARDGIPSYAEPETYSEQLIRLARAMAAAQPGAATGDLAAGFLRDHVQMFVEDIVDKRLDKLKNQLEFVVEGFPNFDELAQQFTQSERLAAYATTTSDGDRMMIWLEHAFDLTPGQKDRLACQRARHQVEYAARRARKAYVRFQEMWSVHEELLSQWHDELTIHLNPVRIWTRFQSRELLDEESDPPVDVLFYATGGEVGTAVLEPHGVRQLRELTKFAPCTLESWAATTQEADIDDLRDLIADLARMGLVALG